MTTEEEQKEKLEIKPSSKISFLIIVAIALGVDISALVSNYTRFNSIFILVPLGFFFTLVMTIIAIYLKRTKKKTDFMVFVLLVIIAGVVITAVTLVFSILFLIFIIGHM